ncbi:MAG: transcriptional regulator [Flavobacteriaceae bacterium]|nr:transcriptional regulator [Flavobacteriaceae bacterium]|tara:strand:+ start:2245 stop:2634 length:390 start_codon:yes stop_codon:yes gene_type:complete
MLNYKNITTRIQNLIKDENLNASAFAERIGVQRSSISHILSGRNKPSLDFLFKITESFPNISLNELVYGDNLPRIPHSIDQLDYSSESLESTLNKEVQENLPYDNQSKFEKSLFILYNDGTFERYSPKS